ncbi:uncharacterized protein DS421_9g272180 [Arachis hypogaea]|nr:uncharacterized protein DS421_9g272180 [Arachis hypogaea]
MPAHACWRRAEMAIATRDISLAGVVATFFFSYFLLPCFFLFNFSFFIFF